MKLVKRYWILLKITYKQKRNEGKMILKNLSIGSKIKYGKYSIKNGTPYQLTWIVADKNHIGYPANSVTLVTDSIIDYLSIDTREPKNPISSAVQNVANDKWSISTLRQYLNKSGLSWYSQSHAYDESPNSSVLDNPLSNYDTNCAFLTNFTSDELSIMLKTTYTTVLSKIYNQSGVEYCTDNVLLMSNTEIGFANENNLEEGRVFEYFRLGGKFCKDNKYSSVCPKAQPNIFFLRTPDSGAVQRTRYCSAVGSLGYGRSSSSYGIRPVVNISDSINVSDNIDSDGYYTLNFNSVLPTIESVAWEFSNDLATNENVIIKIKVGG